MSSIKKENGTAGELEIVNLILCPNCSNKLMTLPQNNPLYDVQCMRCIFRAQVKTNKCKPKPIIFGAGWDIVDKVLKSGFITPSLIANFKWKDEGGDHQEIRFYPFVPKTHLKKRKLSDTAQRANYWMFDYINLDKLPYFELLKK